MSEGGYPEPQQQDPSQSDRGLRDLLAPLSQQGLLSVGRDLRIKGCNESAGRLLGKSPDQLVNRTCDHLPDSIAALAKEALSGQEAIQQRRVTIDAGEGEGTLVQVEIVIGCDSRGEISDVVLGLVDLGGIARLEERLWLLHRFANVGVLSTSVAHEIKNALAFVKTFTDLLAEGATEPEGLDLARLEIQRIDHISRQLLRLSSGGSLELTRLGLHSLIDSSLQPIQHRLDSQQISLARSFQAAPDQIDASEQQLELALINLYLNAIAEMPQGGELRLTTRHDTRGPSIVLTVEDTGPGIPEANLPRLFDPFFTTKADGSGLGLSIVQCIVQRHGGRIWAESHPTGAAFHISLPLSPQASDGDGTK